MGLFTLVPAWIAEDFIVYAVAVVWVVFILRKEKHPESILLEMLCFIVLYAALYENLATIVGWYGYGRTLFMIGNVPLSIPLVEYLVVYSALRVLGHLNVPTWVKPIVVGFAGMLFDFSLDPLAIKQVFVTLERTIGRWTWFMGPHDVGIYGEPVYNFTGWVLICGYAAALLLLGRFWHRRSGYSRAVGLAYPALAMVAALLLVVSPLSSFLLWLEPLCLKGGFSEWIMLGVWLAAPVILLSIFWRGRMREKFIPRQNLPVILTLGGLPLVTVTWTIASGLYQIVWIEALAFLALSGMLAAVSLLPAPVAARRRRVTAPAAARAR
jgi:Carotenoid biosynthesis protein